MSKGLQLERRNGGGFALATNKGEVEPGGREGEVLDALFFVLLNIACTSAYQLLNPGERYSDQACVCCWQKNSSHLQNSPPSRLAGVGHK